MNTVDAYIRQATALPRITLLPIKKVAQPLETITIADKHNSYIEVEETDFKMNEQYF